MSYDDDPYAGGRPVQGGGGPKRSGGDATKAAIETGKYTEVKNRIQLFYAAYPTGRLVTRRVRELLDVDGVLIGWRVDALAYRTPEDTLPGTGTSYMAVPGITPFTRNSELENAETSAWGRAIASVGIAIDKGIATAQEIRAKRGDDDEPPSIPTGPAKQLAEAAAVAAGTEQSQPVSMTASAAPAAEAPAPVEGTPAPEPAGSPEPAGEPAPAPAAPAETPGAGEGNGEAPGANPELVDIVEDAELDLRVAAAVIFGDVKADAPGDSDNGGVTFDEFKSLTRQHFIPNPLISQVARELVEKGAIPQVGGVKELSDHQRTLLLDELIKRSVSNG